MLGLILLILGDVPQGLGDETRRYGRILRGQTEADFITTSDDPDRKVVMFMDESGLEALEGLDGADLLREIGYPEDYIAALIAKGTMFRLVTIEDNGSIIRADWDGVLTMLKRDYPESVWRKVEANLPKLKAMSFAEIEAASGVKFSELRALGKENPYYMTGERLARTNGSLAEVRAFLFNELNLNELFAGDGFTRLEDGSIGVAEFFDRRRPISEYNGVEQRELNMEPKAATAGEPGRLPAASDCPVGFSGIKPNG